MAKIFYESDCDLSLLDGKTVAIIGYGSQGHAHALNLKESGVKVIVGLYEGSKSWKKAEEQGFEVYTSAEAAKKADIIMILINDELQAKLYKESIEPNLEEGNMLMFAHGFNIHFNQIVPPKNVDVTMIAPKAPGHTVRSEYQAGKGTPCLVAVEQNYTGKAQDIALAYSLAIGGASKIVCNEELIGFTIERSNPRELKIAVEENARSTHFQFKLTVSNEYESQEIYVDISPSDRYVIDHITYYSLDEDSYEKRIEAKRSFVQPNGWGIDYPCLLSPYENVYHEVMFRSDMPELFQLLGESNLTVEIPSVENGHLQMNGKQVRYTSKQQTLPFSNTEQIEVSIPPYTTQRITVLIEYYWFETRYALYAVHPKTGKRRTINGTLQNKMPAAYYITRENIK